MAEFVQEEKTLHTYNMLGALCDKDKATPIGRKCSGTRLLPRAALVYDIDSGLPAQQFIK